MGWKRELLEDTAKQYDTPCPNCCKFRLGPMAEDGKDMWGWVWSDEFQAYVEEEMEARDLLEKIYRGDGKKRAALAEKLRKILAKGEGEGYYRNGRFKLGHGPHVVKCPKCDGKGRLETKESRFLRGLAQSLGE